MQRNVSTHTPTGSNITSPHKKGRPSLSEVSAFCTPSDLMIVRVADSIVAASAAFVSAVAAHISSGHGAAHSADVTFNAHVLP